MKRPDYVTIDVFEQPSLDTLRWKRAVRSAISQGIDGLRAATVNHANNGTRSLIPRVFPVGRALVAAWESADAAAAAWAGPLQVALDGPNRFSLDGHSFAMKHALQTKMHRVGCFLQVRPLASAGTLGIDSPPFPTLPPAVRG